MLIITFLQSIGISSLINIGDVFLAIRDSLRRRGIHEKRETTVQKLRFRHDFEQELTLSSCLRYIKDISVSIQGTSKISIPKPSNKLQNTIDIVDIAEMQIPPRV